MPCTRIEFAKNLHWERIPKENRWGSNLNMADLKLLNRQGEAIERLIRIYKRHPIRNYFKLQQLDRLLAENISETTACWMCIGF